MQDRLLLDIEDDIAIMTFNHPKTFNSLDRTLILDLLPKHLETVQTDDRIKVLIVTGAGDAFCSGADVNQLQNILGLDAMSDVEQISSLASFMYSAALITGLKKPVIAAVNGIAAGGGFSLALSCDIRIASEKARFNMAYSRRCLVPDLSGSYWLPRLVGMGKALEIMYAAEDVSAQEAERLGIVNKVVPQDQLMSAAKEFAKKLALLPPVSLALTKKQAYKSLGNSLEEQLELEALNIALCSKTEDFQEGVKAFLEKRPPVFKGK
ncbi:MAG: enoyl-CoA hydratase/isomerase family protein [Desulfatiglans sp.]|jgi:2-(1,2-epoxy-1,2-dihydrophenyl)acetyl-CoA isomerase|nr:enoyl-CoA hydratase/isomerase family protein [Thermodesulfobacteriota bacterium]MEE4353682.1 enoyl-CoA hydratase/isomerase family protein [Desulfatiglans sp.]